MDAYLAAMEEILALQNQEVMEIAKRGVGLARFDSALKAARAKSDATRAAWMEHLAEHGC